MVAVNEGRTSYDNIQKFLKYILTGNAGKIFVMLLGPLTVMAIFFLTMQILWINLVTDGVPAVALGYEQTQKDIMQRPLSKPQKASLPGVQTASISSWEC